MSNTKRMTVNVPIDLHERCTAAIDGVYLLNMSQLVLVAMSDLVAQRQSPPLPSSPLHPPTPNTPPIISPKGDIYTPPKGSASKPKSKPGAPEKPSKDFEAFWDIYPRKVSKRNAWKAYFSAVKLVEPSRILRGLEAAVEHEFASLEMRLIPHASTWINGRRWEDTFEEKPRAAKKAAPVQQVRVDYTESLRGESCDYWSECLERINEEVGGYDFINWFRPVRAISVDNTLVIGCPDKAHVDWLMQNYRELLSRAISMRFRVVDAEEFSQYPESS